MIRLKISHPRCQLAGRCHHDLAGHHACARPTADTLHLLTHEKLAGLWEHTAHFDHVLTFAKSESPFVIGKRLKPEGFDAALILPNSLRTALELGMGFAAHRLCRKLAKPIAHPRHCTDDNSHAEKVAIDIEFRLINHLQPQTFPATAHHIHQYLHLAQHMGASAQPLAPQLKRTGDVPAFSATKQPRPYVGLIAGAEYGQPSVGPPSILSRPLPN